MTMDPPQTDSALQNQTAHSQASSSSTQTSPPTHSASSGPQIRSRITVVCAECKRLKLKCDRRNPCGSCTKRDTVHRCVYSPAAAEKVDLHSLNNRLMQVESLLALLTAGNFVSSYPPSVHASQLSAQAHGIALLPSSVNPGSSTGLLPSHSNVLQSNHQNVHHIHHHHTAATFTTNDSPLLKIPIEDLTSFFLNDLDLALHANPRTATNNINVAMSNTTSSFNNTHGYPPSSSRSLPFSSGNNVRDNGYIKIEPSVVELSQAAAGSGSSHQPIIIGSDFDPHPSSYSHDFAQPLHRPQLPLSQQHQNHTFYGQDLCASPAPFGQPPSASSRSPTPDSGSANTSHPQISSSISHRRRRRLPPSNLGSQALRLPPPTVYYAQPLNPESTRTGNHKPSISPELLSYLPALPICLGYLERAESVLRSKGYSSLYALFSRSPSPSQAHTSTTDQPDPDGSIASTWLRDLFSQLHRLATATTSLHRHETNDTLIDQDYEMQLSLDATGTGGLSTSTSSGNTNPGMSYYVGGVNPSGGNAGGAHKSRAGSGELGQVREGRSSAGVGSINGVHFNVGMEMMGMGAGMGIAAGRREGEERSARGDDGSGMMAPGVSAHGEERGDIGEVKGGLPMMMTICALLAYGAFIFADETDGSASTTATGSMPLGSAGAADSESQAEEHYRNAEFLYALSAQVENVWEEWAGKNGPSGVGRDDEGEYQDLEEYYASFDGSARVAPPSRSQPKDTTQIGARQVVFDASNEHLLHLTGLLVRVAFIILEESGNLGCEDGRESMRGSALFPLLGKLVNAARGTGLAQDPAATSSPALSQAGDILWRYIGESHIPESDRDEKETSMKQKMLIEWKRRIWWDVLYFDLFVSDAFGQAPLINNHSYSTRFPSFASTLTTTGKQPERSNVRHSSKSQLTAPFEPSTDEFDDEERPVSVNPTFFDDALTLGGGFSGSYLEARYRLIQIARAIRHRLTYPDCCCGYTIDQASALEGEVQNWMSNYSIRSEHLQAASLEDSNNYMDAIQNAELSLWGWKLILKIWLPFLRAPVASSPPSRPPSIPVSQSHSRSRSQSTASSTPFNPSSSSSIPTSGSWGPRQSLINSTADTVITGSKYSGHGSSTSTPDNTWTPPFQAMRSIVSAGQTIIRATKTMMSVWQKMTSTTNGDCVSSFAHQPQEFTHNTHPHRHHEGRHTAYPTASTASERRITPGITHPSQHVPALLDLCTMESTLFDAAIICAHAGIVGRAMWGVAVMEDVYVGLNLLTTLLRSGEATGSKRTEIMNKIAGALMKRIDSTQGTHSKTSMKRKHDQAIENDTSGQSALDLPMAPVETMASSQAQNPTMEVRNGAVYTEETHNPMTMVAQPEPMPASSSMTTLVLSSSEVPPSEPHHQSTRPPSRHSSHKSSPRLHLRSPATNTTALSNHNTGHNVNGPEKKKHSKKMSYPPVGIRVRPGGKDSLLSKKHANGNAHVSSPGPAEDRFMPPPPSAPSLTSTPVLGPIPGSASVSVINGLHPGMSAPLPRIQEDHHRSRSGTIPMDYRHAQPPQHHTQEEELADFLAFRAGSSDSPQMIPVPMTVSSQGSQRHYATSSFDSSNTFEVENAGRNGNGHSHHTSYSHGTHTQLQGELSGTVTTASAAGMFGPSVEGGPYGPTAATASSLASSFAVAGGGARKKNGNTNGAANSIHRNPPTFGPSMANTSSNPSNSGSASVSASPTSNSNGYYNAQNGYGSTNAYSHGGSVEGSDTATGLFSNSSSSHSGHAHAHHHHQSQPHHEHTGYQLSSSMTGHGTGVGSSSGHIVAGSGGIATHHLTGWHSSAVSDSAALEAVESYWEGAAAGFDLYA